jgi:hypothetical protein
MVGLGIDRRFVILAPKLFRRFPPKKSGHKKTGLNMRSTGITSVPGLFSEFFNVAASRPAQMTTGRNQS